MVGRAAADDVDAAHRADGVLVQFQLREVDLAVLEARRQRVAHGGRLFVDLFHHEMLIAAFFGSLGIPLDGGGLVLDGFLVDVEKLDGVRRQARDLEVVDVVHRAGVLEQRRHVGRDDGAVFAPADDERAVLAHGVDDARLVGKQDAQCVGAAHMHHHAGDGVQRVAGRGAGIVVVQQLGHDLGIGLRGKGKALVVRRSLISR